MKKWKKLSKGFKVAVLVVATLCVTEVVIKVIESNADTKDLNSVEKGAICVGTILLSTFITEKTVESLNNTIFKQQPNVLEESVMSLIYDEQSSES